MKGKKILYVSSEMLPYSAENPMSVASFETPKQMNEKGVQTRIFMPRFGNINERRHQLHEVIRLSGMNLIINDMDLPLIIKVASIPKERLQTYFIDNEEFFKRKSVYGDSTEAFFKDNDQRMIFFAKGVIETIKKLNWSPDIIHVHGWFASLIPLYIKSMYKDDPIFSNTKVVISLYDNDFEGNLSENFNEKLNFDKISVKNEESLNNATYFDYITNVLDFVDGVVLGQEAINPKIKEAVEQKGIAHLANVAKEDIAEAYSSFYKDSILED